MQEDKYLWVWVGGASALIVLVLGGWWWHVGTMGTPGEMGYDTTTLGDEALEGSLAPTLPVPVEPLPTLPRGGAKPAAVADTVLGALAGIPDASRFAALLASTGAS